MAKPRQKNKPGRTGRTIAYVLLVGVIAVICFYPITRYYFLQDDFTLLANVAFDRNATVANTFGSESDLFRPLTKIAYFGVMHGLFGLNPLPYHLVSLAIHVLNTLLVFVLLRRFRIERIPALVATALFAFHVGFFDVVAWISCIQQLAGQAFMLAGLILGVRAVDTKRPLLVVLAASAYVLALLSLEQTYALPLLLFLYAYTKEKVGPARNRAGRALRDTAPYLALMVLYLVYMAASKGVPEEGPYKYRIGANVITNLFTYLDWVFAFSVVMPFVVDVSSTGLTSAHVVLAILLIYSLAKGRKRVVIFSTAYYVLTILPLLFLEGHAFYLHNYIPSVGVLCLMAPVVEDLFKVVRDWNRRFVPATAVILIGLAAIICYTKVRANETNYLRPDLPLPNDFVLRRAVIAKHTFDDVTVKGQTQSPPKNLFMVYTSEDGWYKYNVVAALGQGSALKLFYSEPDLNVTFHEKGDTLYGYNVSDSRIFFFDYMGRCFTPEEMDTEEGAAIKPIESD